MGAKRTGEFRSIHTMSRRTPGQITTQHDVVAPSITILLIFPGWPVLSHIPASAAFPTWFIQIRTRPATPAHHYITFLQII